ALAKAFDAAGSVKLGVLYACYSEEHAVAVAAHIDCVVGMGGGAVDGAAMKLAIGLYRGPGGGGAGGGGVQTGARGRGAGRGGGKDRGRRPRPAAAASAAGRGCESAGSDAAKRED